MKKALYLFLLLPALSFAQSKGIRFAAAGNWEEVVAQAKAEKKMIFIDAFTTWCGPCQYLSKEIFTKEEVGRFFNERFINVKLQLDTTANDNETVRSWYPFAGKLMQGLKINVFPTLLFFDENGNPLHRIAGAPDAAGLVEYAKKASDPELQYYTLLSRYEKGEREPSLMERLVRGALQAYQMETVRKVFPELLEMQGNQLTKENVTLIYDATNAIEDHGLKLIAEDPERFDEVYGKKGAADTKIRGILFDHLLQKAFDTKLDGRFLETTGALRRSYGKRVDEPEAKAKTNYYQRTKNWAKFVPAATDYMKRFGSTVTPDDQNAMAWAFFEQINDRKALEEAAKWSKASLAAKDPNFMDTYANLLHKLGRTAEAIQWQEKAIAAATTGQKEGLRATLAKMKKGQKTW